MPYSQALFDAIFAKGLAIDDAILTAIATNLGISQTDFQSHLKSNDTQNQLDLLTEEAFNRGVFGVPTFLFGSEMFWGNDRLVLLQHYLKKSS